MVIVDSSIWIRYLRDPKSFDGQVMDGLLVRREVTMVGPVLVEILQGFRSDQEFSYFQERLSKLEFLDTDLETWETMSRLGYQLRRTGESLAFSDLLISALAIRYDYHLYAIDHDFVRVPGLKLYDPAGDEVSA